MTTDPTVFYREQSEQLAQELAQLEGYCRVGGLARGVTFLIVGTLFFSAFFDYRGLALALWIAFAVAVVLFLVVVVVHQAYEDARAVKQIWYDFYQQGLARQQRDWDRIDNPKSWVTEQRHEDAQQLLELVGLPMRPVGPLEHAAISDLDLEGSRSLWQLINLARSEMGQELLSQWMLQPSNRSDILRRQEAVQALVEDSDWRHQFLLTCRQAVQKDSSPSNVVRWAIGPKLPNWIRALIQVARLNSALIVLFIGLLISGLMGPDRAATALMVLVGANFLISVATAGRVHEIFRQVGARAKDVARYYQLFEQIEQVAARTEFLQKLKQDLVGADGKPRQSYRVGMRRLILLSQLSNLRSGMTFVLYVVLQFGFLWDLHILDRLEAWRKQWGQRVPAWFHVLGQFEALATLAQLRFDHPDWQFPKIIDDHAVPDTGWICGKNVGHPLLGEQGVANDLVLGKAGQTLLVTGSNMSGKSTYLRTIGVNLILARMGSVVSANHLQTPPVEIGTSMRVADSLSDGVSFFMSELKRLKQVVDHARNCQTQNGIKFVYLLDEILQGTNSQERQIAVTRVIQQLLRSDAVGALSTHDLQLPEVADLKGKLDIVHFKESFQQVDGREQMVFDYQLRPGMTPTTNALKLLALVGLDDDA